MRFRFELRSANFFACAHRENLNWKCQHLMDGCLEARLLALARSQPPQGHRRWSLRLLVSEMARLEYKVSPSDSVTWQYYLTMPSDADNARSKNFSKFSRLTVSKTAPG